jgi:putative hydrolase of the HAD superfamily
MDLTQYDVISIDMFQTLVDVGSMRFHFWRQVLGEKYSKDLVDLYGGQWRHLFPDHFKQAIENSGGFVNVKTIFEGYWELLFNKFDIAFDPLEARRVHFEIHRLAPAYDDAEKFVDTMRSRYPVCLVSDSDVSMIRPHLDRFGFDSVFISEQLRAYKGDPENRMFGAVIEHYRVPPEKIIHIGDMHTDVIGAKQAGMAACWLNRDRLDWQHEVEPDFEVKSLFEVAEILGHPIRPDS